MRHLLFYILISCAAGPAASDDIPKLGGRFERYAEIHEFAYQILADLNARSIDLNREFCGFIYFDPEGNLKATKADKGSVDGCLLSLPDEAGEVFASYHTHAAYAEAYLNEYPSDIDMVGDFEFGRSGYIATPGGRMWFIDYEKQVARQLCGYRCMTFDHDYVENPREQPKERLNLQNLYSIFQDG